MNTRTDVMIVDTDRKRSRALRRILKDTGRNLKVEDVTETANARSRILSSRPTLVLLHSAFPYLEEDGTGLLELIQEDFRNVNIGVMLVLPISGSLLYRSGYQEGSEMLEMANDLITTDFTSDMIQSVVCEYIDRQAEKVAQEAVEGDPEFIFAPSKKG